MKRNEACGCDGMLGVCYYLCYTPLDDGCAKLVILLQNPEFYHIDDVLACMLQSLGPELILGVTLHLHRRNMFGREIIKNTQCGVQRVWQQPPEVVIHD